MESRNDELKTKCLSQRCRTHHFCSFQKQNHAIENREGKIFLSMYEAANRRSEICIRKACARLVIRVRNIHFSVCSLPRSRKDVRERSRASDLSFVDSFRAFFAIILLLDHIMRVSLAKCTRFYHWRPQFEWRWCDRSEREREWIWIKMVPSLRPRNLLSLLVREDWWNLLLDLKFPSVNSWYMRQHGRFELAKNITIFWP